MTNKQKVTRRSLFASVLSLTVCAGMLVGTSYAWFTDTATSSGNIVKTGTLNIDLAIKTKTDEDYVSVKTDTTKKAFNYERWEPGYTEWVNAKVFTTGNLALKYTMKINADGEVTDLADVIDVYYKDSAVQKPSNRDLSGLQKIGTLRQALNGDIVINDTLIPGAADADTDETAGITDQDFATIALHMQEEAGNEYQNMSIGSSFSFQILATQYTYEIDSFDDKYDAGAHNYELVSTTVDGVTVPTSKEFADSLGTNAAGKVNRATAMCPEDLVALSTLINSGKTAAGEGNGSAFTIGDDIDMSSANYTPIGTMFSSFDGQGHKISNLNNSLFDYAGAVTLENIVLENVNVTAATAGIIAGNGEGLTLKNVEIAGTNTVTYDPDGWHVHNAEHRGAGVLTALDAGVTVGDGVKITGDVTVNYNDVEFKFGNNYDLDNSLVTTMFGAKYAATPSDASAIAVSGNITTNGSYTCWQKPVTMSIGGSNYEVTPAFAASLGHAWDDGQISSGERFTAEIKTANDLGALNKMFSVSPWVGGDWSNVVTIDITEDLDFAEVEWTPIGGRASFKIEGNNHTISNIDDSFMSYAGYTIINNLTLENVTASGEKKGAFAGAAEGLTLNNCVLAGNINVSYEAKTTETWRGVGAFIGWQSEDATFNNVSIAENAVINVVTTGIENGHADASLLSHNAYVGKGAIPTITVGTGATVTLTE